MYVTHLCQKKRRVLIRWEGEKGGHKVNGGLGNGLGFKGFGIDRV